MIIDDIVNSKREGLQILKATFSPQGLIEGLKRRLKDIPPARDFLKALEGAGVKIIAEIKKASPSKGIIRKRFDPEYIAGIYEDNGAAAISVVTEEKFFHGSLDYLRSVKNKVSIPVLRKDFILDEYQIYESRVAGADCILLIASLLSKAQMEDFMALSQSLGMGCLVEVHKKTELDMVLSTNARLIGINNRNLKTFRTDINTTKRLIGKIPEDRIVVSESGINTYKDIYTLEGAGVKAFLIGEALMREEDIGRKLRELRGF